MLGKKLLPLSLEVRAFCEAMEKASSYCLIVHDEDRESCKVIFSCWCERHNPCPWCLRIYLRWWVTQSWNPEFKPQYHIKKTKKEEEEESTFILTIFNLKAFKPIKETGSVRLPESQWQAWQDMWSNGYGQELKPDHLDCLNCTPFNHLPNSSDLYMCSFIK
jgi:hypothetical protein